MIEFIFSNRYIFDFLQGQACCASVRSDEQIWLQTWLTQSLWKEILAKCLFYTADFVLVQLPIPKKVWMENTIWNFSWGT